MILEISTPEKILFDGEVRAVQCPGEKGSFQILDKHAPMVAALTKGRIKCEPSDNSPPQIFEITRGVLQVLDNKVIILFE
jgi:F-type H+-transporting ATPase subunit epsilon